MLTQNNSLAHVDEPELEASVELPPRFPIRWRWTMLVGLAVMLAVLVLSLVILDMVQTGKVPEILAALQEKYRPVVGEVFYSRNTPFYFLIPRNEGEPFAPLAESLDDLYPLSPLEPSAQ